MITMQRKIDEELRKICEEISSFEKSIEEWRKIESCDMFQTKHYCGGFEAEEDAFWFSFYDSKDKEYYFKLTLENVNDILSEKLSFVELRPTT